jgi:hypothetical protein
VVVVQKLSEAELLAYLPVEHYKIESDSLMKPDVSRVRKIVALCKQYQYSSSAARRLETWLADQPRQ